MVSLSNHSVALRRAQCERICVYLIAGVIITVPIKFYRTSHLYSCYIDFAGLFLTFSTGTISFSSRRGLEHSLSYALFRNALNVPPNTFKLLDKCDYLLKNGSFLREVLRIQRAHFRQDRIEFCTIFTGIFPFQ